MTAYAWDIVADTVKEILAADEYRDELVVQLHAQAINGADPVFLAFGEEATDSSGILLGNMGHSARVLGAKARLAVSAISAAVSSGGIETHSFIEYRHVLNYPIWQKLQPNQDKPTVVHYSPLDDSVDIAVDFDPFIIMFDMNVQAGVGNIVIHKESDDSVVETIAIGDATIGGGNVEFSLTAPLEAGIEYYVLIASGVMESTDSVAWGGTADSTTWSFTTAS